MREEKWTKKPVKETIVTTVEWTAMKTTSEDDEAAAGMCGGCGAPMKDHRCPSTMVPRTARRVAEDLCAVCGEKMHFQESSWKVRQECAMRLYRALASADLPLESKGFTLTPEQTIAFGQWLLLNPEAGKGAMNKSKVATEAKRAAKAGEIKADTSGKPAEDTSPSAVELGIPTITVTDGLAESFAPVETIAEDDEFMATVKASVPAEVIESIPAGETEGEVDTEAQAEALKRDETTRKAARKAALKAIKEAARA